jgi:hypothetical protein
MFVDRVCGRLVARIEETRYGTKTTTVRDPDGRVWGLQVPLTGEPRKRA